jgi:hypothetical protein
MGLGCFTAWQLTQASSNPAIKEHSSRTAHTQEYVDEDHY